MSRKKHCTDIPPLILSLQVFLILPSAQASHTIWASLGSEPTADSHSLEVHVVDDVNITRNDLNATIDYTKATCKYVKLFLLKTSG